MSKIILSDNVIEIPLDKIGIDMGQTLSKIAYLNGDKLQLSYYLTQSDLSSLKIALESNIKQFKKINFTGGRSFNLYQHYSKIIETKLINEFEANVKGIEILHLIEKKERDIFFVNCDYWNRNFDGFKKRFG